MKIGFVNFNTDERKRVAKMMQLLQESEAIEELGNGRVRDHFSNTLFPGTSTLQHHAKYFVLLPSLYYHVAYESRRFHSLEEVRRYIKEAEIQLTRQLAHWKHDRPNTTETGITGINTLKEALKDHTKYVKYDPAYIYGSGLSKFGIIPDTGIERLIWELNKKHFENHHRQNIQKNEEGSEDANELSGEIQLIKTCGEHYDFFNGETMSLSLTSNESSFLKDRIHATCNGSLLDYLIECKYEIPAGTDYYTLSNLLTDLSPEMTDVYHKSVLFSKLMLLIDWRFNFAYYDRFDMNEEADHCMEKYFKFLSDYSRDLSNKDAYNSLFDYMRHIDLIFTEFYENCYNALMHGDHQTVDQLIIAREYAVKRERSKIGNKSYKGQKRVSPGPNTFRWETVSTMIKEIRNPY